MQVKLLAVSKLEKGHVFVATTLEGKWVALGETTYEGLDVILNCKRARVVDGKWQAGGEVKHLELCGTTQVIIQGRVGESAPPQVQGLSGTDPPDLKPMYPED